MDNMTVDAEKASQLILGMENAGGYFKPNYGYKTEIDWESFSVRSNL